MHKLGLVRAQSSTTLEPSLTLQLNNALLHCSYVYASQGFAYEFEPAFIHKHPILIPVSCR